MYVRTAPISNDKQLPFIGVNFMKTNELLFLLLFFASASAVAQQASLNSVATNNAAFANLKSRAELGDAEAEYQLGLAYSHGVGVPTNYAAALDWFGKSANQGSAESENNLGQMYENGQGAAQDYTQAYKWYNLSAARGDQDADRHRDHLEYLMTRVQIEKAQKMSVDFELNSRLSPGATNSGFIDTNAEAVAVLRQRAERGDAEADSALGDRYGTGDGVPKSRVEATKWVIKAGRDGDAKYFGLIAVLYYRGDPACNVFTNHAEAERWFEKSAQAGNIHAEPRVGDFYRDGDGVPQNYALAVEWYRKAANHFESTGVTDLGEMYEKGRGVPRDYVEAYKWYDISFKAGSYAGMQNRERLAGSMTPSQIAQAEKMASDFMSKLGPLEYETVHFSPDPPSREATENLLNF